MNNNNNILYFQISYSSYAFTSALLRLFNSNSTCLHCDSFWPFNLNSKVHSISFRKKINFLSFILKISNSLNIVVKPTIKCKKKPVKYYVCLKKNAKKQFKIPFRRSQIKFFAKENAFQINSQANQIYRF